MKDVRYAYQYASTVSSVRCRSTAVRTRTYCYGTYFASMYTRASLAIATFPREEFPGRGLVTSLFAKEACTTAAYTRIASLAKRDAGATDAVIVTNAGATQASGIFNSMHVRPSRLQERGWKYVAYGRLINRRAGFDPENDKRLAMLCNTWYDAALGPGLYEYPLCAQLLCSR